MTALLFVDDVIKQPRLKWLQRRLLIAEELGLRLAHLAALLCVAVERVVGDGFSSRCEQVGGEFVGIESGHLVIDEVLQVVGVPVLLRSAQEDHGLADEECGPWLVSQAPWRSRERSHRAVL